MKLLENKRFEEFIQFLIVISLICYAIETLPELPVWIQHALILVETLTICIFAIEFFLRLWTNRTEYLFSFDAAIDILATLPLIMFSHFGFVRLFRLFRLIKLVNNSEATNRICKAFYSIKNDLILLLEVCLVLIFISSAIIYHFEHEAQPEHFKSIPHSFWWAMITFTTVGYGDVFPITTGGKIFTTIFISIGIGLIAIPTGLIASAYSKIPNEDENT